jgi:hypothetical protein
MTKVILHGSRVRQYNPAGADRDFLIIADHPLDREIITKLKDGLYDIELENNEVVSSIIRSRQEWSSPEYDALPFKKAVEKEGGRAVNYKEDIIRYRVERLKKSISSARLSFAISSITSAAVRLDIGISFSDKAF